MSGSCEGFIGPRVDRYAAWRNAFVFFVCWQRTRQFSPPPHRQYNSHSFSAFCRARVFLYREGDVVVLATDGLLDNMYEADILRCIHVASEDDVEATSPERPADLAAALARRAFTLSRDKERLSPWEEEAVAAGVVPERSSVNGSPAGGARQESSWNAGMWGLALERAVTAGLDSFRRASEQSAQGDDQGISSMPEEDMTDFRGGKMDDITVLVATVRRSASTRNKSATKDEANKRKREIRGANGGTRVGVDAQGRQ